MSFGKYALRCVISRGGFSDERVFKIDIGNFRYEGVASRLHLWRQDGTPVEEGEPPIGEEMEGFVAARILKVNGEEAIVLVPDGEAIRIPKNALADRPGAESHVSV